MKSFYRHFAGLAALMLLAGPAMSAEPSRYFMGTMDRNPLTYRCGEKMTVTISYYENDVRKSGVPLQWEVTGDDGAKTSGKAVSDAAQPLVLSGSIRKPGFVRFKVSARDAAGKLLPGKGAIFDGGAGAEIEKLRQGIPEPKDFDAFWKKQLVKARSVKGKATLTRLADPAPGIALYEYSVPAYGLKPGTGYIAMPAGAKAKTLPMVIVYQGYGCKSAEAEIKWAKKGVIAVTPNIHGEKNGQPEEYYKKLSRGPLRGFALHDNRDPENCYLNGVIMRNIVTLDFLKTLPEWDGKTIRINSGSMGAFQTMVMAHLFPEITSCSISIPWLCDVGGFLTGRQKGWRPDYEEGLNYYDTVNHAKRVRCPVDVHYGLGDYVCPPSGVTVLCNGLKKPGKIVALLNRRHGYCGPKTGSFRYRPVPVKQDMR